MFETILNIGLIGLALIGFVFVGFLCFVFLIRWWAIWNVKRAQRQEERQAKKNANNELN